MTEVKAKSLKNKKNLAKIIAEPGKQEIFIIREFNAPRELVFKAFIDPNLLIQWLGPKGHSTIIDFYEPKSGGKWRFITKDKDGNEFSFHGTVHEVLEPKRLIRTFEYDGLPETGHVALETAVFEEISPYRTKIIMQSVFLSVADRDGMVQSGMEKGVHEEFERLDVLLEKLVSD